MRKAAPSLAELERIGLFVWGWPDGPATMPERLIGLTALGFDTADYTHALSDRRDAAHWRDYWYHAPLPFSSDKQGARPDGTRWRSRPPSWTRAWKYPSQRALAGVRGIEFRIGRTWRITPLVYLDPVRIEGRRVSRCGFRPQAITTCSAVFRLCWQTPSARLAAKASCSRGWTGWATSWA